MKRMDATTIKEAEAMLNAALAILPSDLDAFAVELGHRVEDDGEELSLVPTVSIHSMVPVCIPGFDPEYLTMGDGMTHAHLHLDENTEVWWAVYDR